MTLDKNLTVKCIGSFSELLKNSTHMMKKTIFLDSTRLNVNKNTWFDKECREKKRLVNKYLRKYSKLHCPENKSIYIQQRRE